MTPTVGRVVHYRSYGTPGGEYLPEARMAFITAVPVDYTGTLSLMVVNPTGFFFKENVDFSPEPLAGHWSWPPRVSA